MCVIIQYTTDLTYDTHMFTHIFHSITLHHITLLYFAYIMHVCMCMIAMCIPALRSYVHTTCIHASMPAWMHAYIHLHILRERERERWRKNHMHVIHTGSSLRCHIFPSPENHQIYGSVKIPTAIIFLRETMVGNPRSMSARGSHILDVSLPDSLENLLESPIFKWIKHDKTW